MQLKGPGTPVPLFERLIQPFSLEVLLLKQIV